MHELLVDEVPVCPVELAVTARSRSRGLLGRHGLDGALWLAPARQVHTYRMQFAIDVAMVDVRGRVIRVSTMPPGKLGPWSWRCRAVIEAEAGRFESWGLSAGRTVGVHSLASGEVTLP